METNPLLFIYLNVCGLRNISKIFFPPLSEIQFSTPIVLFLWAEVALKNWEHK